MATPLLKTKLYISPPRPDLVPRPRLFERLDAGLRLGSHLTLLSAPAGSGKTTLLCEWIASSGHRTAWLSLDETDNDPQRFWTYLVAALQTAHADLGQDVWQLCQMPQLPPIESLLTSLINEIAAFPNQIVLVLDDYHAISTADIHSGIAFLLEHQPRQLHLVLSTRVDPPLPIARLRAKRQLTELRARDLRFMHDEAAAFLREIMALDLSSADVAALQARTEGWIVGLQLAGLSMQGQDVARTREFVAAFAGSHHYVLEYLTEEVLRRQPEPVRRFLVQTSILEQLSGALCDAVTGNGDSESLLTYLRRRNLFLISLDDEHIWYRYHHLFADLLGNLLRKESSVEQICELHRRASAWYEGHDDLDAAIGHAMQAHDFDRTASLIERAFAEVLSQGHVATLLRWMEALPKEVRLGRSRLCMYLGWSMFLNGQYAQAEQRLRDARKALEAMLPSPERDALRGELGAMLATIATLHQDAPTTMREAQDALAQLPADKLSSRARATRALGIAYGLSGDTDRLVRVCGEAKSLAMAGGNTFLAAEVISRIGFAQVDQGRLRQAVRSYQEIADLVAHPAGFPPACLGYVGLALVSLEWNDLNAVLEYLDQGIELCRRGGIGYVLRPAYCIRAILLQARGDAEGALAAMDQAVQLPGLAGSADAAVQLAQYQVRLHLLRGDVETAARWATGEIGVYRPLGDGPRPFEHLPPVLHEIHQVALARVYLAQGIPNGVMALSDHIYASAHAAGRMARVIEISLLRALALYAQGQLEAALAPLGECLSLAGPEGYVRLFLEAGDAAMALVRLATERGIEETYGRRLLAASGWVEPAHAASPSVPIEPLTRRERQVLQLIGDGFSNQEIADRLVVSLNTIKKHSSNIYGKLGVTSRTQAIVRAQETGIL